ncbi:acylneuraminate cytidylyltransferase family protein [Clostridium sp. E02]|uniref:acylneuraminate cytidylyltransferase family protein n=1 Tax=Clostridium sp. E02 TaxID=2487134 RepID=UPI000F53957C|nr:acylneuraminate cytidylyltransferase family protein [Clostridium sp. E02]
MFQNKTFLALIPARSGSKGLKDKNIKELNEKPLMSYTIEACKNSGIFDKIMVSTDSNQYKMIAETWGADVPFLRPASLSCDEAKSADVILHTLNELKSQGETYDYFMLLQPTSPLRNELHIKESAELLLSRHGDSVVSICPIDSHRQLTVSFTRSGSITVPFPHKAQVRRQEEHTGYRINGAIYLTSTNFFLKQGNFYDGTVFPYYMDSIHSIDIDDSSQFRIAELLLRYGGAWAYETRDDKTSALKG